MVTAAECWPPWRHPARTTAKPPASIIWSCPGRSTGVLVCAGQDLLRTVSVAVRVYRCNLRPGMSGEQRCGSTTAGAA